MKHETAMVNIWNKKKILHGTIKTNDREYFGIFSDE